MPADLTTASAAADADGDSPAIRSSDAGDLPALLGRSELARHLAVSTRSLDRLDASGSLPAAIRVGGIKRWRRKEIDAWLAEGAPSRKEWESLQRSNRGRKR